MAKAAFIGLGVMGYPMAGHLQRHGHSVTVYNRSPAKAARWVAEHGGRSARTPREAAEGAEFVFTCVGNDDDLRAVVLGYDGALAGMREGAVLADHTTASTTVARELAGLAEGKGVAFLDAPVSGGQTGAEKGALSVMAGGEAVAFGRARPVIESYAKVVALMGPTGAGQLTKMVNQICAVGVINGLAEGIHFAKRAGLDVGKVMEVLREGAARSWQMENRSATMAAGKFDFGFAVEWMRKDLGICLAEARLNGAKLPATALIDQLYAEVEAMGGARWDSSSLIARLERR
ncbi:MAG: NAD(P)-dependent oxidoreductase [Bauldia sp.]|nr:NAD(P)-dependent oxidoreductase [Bauldia sp.]